MILRPPTHATSPLQPNFSHGNPTLHRNCMCCISRRICTCMAFCLLAQHSRLSYFLFESGRNRTCSSRRVSALNFPSSFLNTTDGIFFLPHAGLSHITHVPMTCRVLSNLSYVVFSETTSRRKCLLSCNMQFPFAMNLFTDTYVLRSDFTLPWSLTVWYDWDFDR